MATDENTDGNVVKENVVKQVVTIGLDAGTTGCKAVALSPAGQLLETTSGTYPLKTDASGRAEQDPEAIWSAVCKALRSLAKRLPDHHIAGIALSGAMHSVLPLSSNYQPLTDAITWADSRASDYPERLRERTDPAALYARTGCPLETPYHPARLNWLHDSQPDVFAKTHTFAALKDFLVLRLSGTLMTDIGLASTTGLFDIYTLTWQDQALVLAGIGPDKLPEFGLPTDRAGTLTDAAATATGLPAGLPIFLGSSDGGLANLGSGVVRAGETILTLGTSGAVRQVADAPQLDPNQLTWCYVLGEGHYFAGGAINNGGLTLEWLRRTFYSELPSQAGFAKLLEESAEAASSDLICLPYLTGERTPHWDADLRASFFGIGEHHTRADLVRAGLEGVAFCLADVFELVRPSDRPVQLSGGAARAPFLAQLLTDTLGVPTETNDVADASALGAAVIAQVGLGLTTLSEAAARLAHASQARLEPNPEAHAHYREKRARARNLLEAVASVTAKPTSAA